ncbi:DUF498-domain-containing protein [Coprinopsis marcescibilis]|uniref:NADH dehydrogenase [ubiquinone] 1 alpha subcomplex assembly factor 3 n=1 Tax=Coprinopsis marcescibilis TaxID=230819 RepID=A0A5C3L8E4_COPMA|nr:DUF498-domain-containing protein [Coprinopsis marcescibilis]
MLCRVAGSWIIQQCRATGLCQLPTVTSIPQRRLHTTPRRLDRSFTNILADSENPPPVQVSSISPEGIQLADGLKLPGPSVFLDGRVFLWDVPAVGEPGKNPWKGWTEAHFELFDTVIPAPEILLFGTGKRIMQPPAFLRAYLNQRGIQLDILDTRNACSTYNLLSEEGRRVAAALLPLSPQTWKKAALPGNPGQ